MVPVLFADPKDKKIVKAKKLHRNLLLPVEGWEHDGHDDLVVLLYEGHDVLIVPEVESPLSNLAREGDYRTPDQDDDDEHYLEVRARHTLGNLFKEWLLDLDELSWLNNIKNLLNLPQKHHFFL